MDITIHRHAKTHQDSESGRDEDRLLMDRGHRQAAAIAAHLMSLDCPPDHVIASPATRAIQTATPIWESTGLKETLESRISLSAYSDHVFDLIAEFVSAPDRGRHLVLVGHNPTMSSVASTLLGGITGQLISLRTGEMYRFRLEDHQEFEIGNPLELIESFRPDL